MARFKLDAANPPALAPERQAALDALTEAQITAGALSDPDNPPLTDDEIDRAALAAMLRRVRRGLGLTQQEFAARYRITYGRLRDIERGRGGVRPDSALAAYLRVIERETEAVDRALAG